MDDAGLERLLSDPSIYPRGGAPEIVRTHCSYVALVGREAFKVKRAVRYAFLDFSTAAARLTACREELRLNRRLAPGMYQGLVALVPGPGGELAFRDIPEDEPPPATAVAFGVRMRRLTAHEMLDGRLARGEVDHEMLGRIADRLARFHRDGERGTDVDRAADPEHLRGLAEDNLAALAGRASGPERIVTDAVLERLRAATADFFRERGGLLERRIAEGRAVDGHGDLHAGNVWISGDELLVYDALEFDADLRRGDAALDLAFLLMDLDRAGHRASAAWLAREYARLAGDETLGQVIDGFKTYRALVRAKVAGLRMEDAGAEERAAMRREGVAFVALATSYALAPSIVLMRGLPASGKSWYARRIAAMIGAALHRSDVRRHEVEARAGGAVSERYGDDAKLRTYAALLDDARAELAAGRSVVVDASFLDAEWRAPFLELARESGAPLVVVEPQVSHETARERLERRRADANEPSEADWRVFQELARRARPPQDLAPGMRVVLAEDAEWPDAALAVLDALVAAPIRP